MSKIFTPYSYLSKLHTLSLKIGLKNFYQKGGNMKVRLTKKFPTRNWKNTNIGRLSAKVVNKSNAL